MIMQPPLHIEIIGNKALPKIVFLHGFLGSGRDWLPLAEMLTSHYCCVLVDLPGHGSATLSASDEHHAYFTATVEALATVIQPISPEPCRLVGYSMGGRIALALMLTHPELFHQAVIVSASPGLPTEEERAKRRAGDEGIARKIERNFPDFLEAWYQQPLFSTLKNHPLFQEIERKRAINNSESLAAALRLLGTGQQPSFWDALSKCAVPTLFIAGEKDERYVAIARQMVKLAPHATLSIVPNCGHTLHIENKESFVEQLHTFFNQ
uniref:Putative 2-succinyl-6-hydroxy-2,4-cyclohexadiene-1-carboxylate synthase n=1 Tax=Chlorobium chlorochromatii (strain CaD3) TaxID=340177 RepID=Q3APV4_CHLCH